MPAVDPWNFAASILMEGEAPALSDEFMKKAKKVAAGELRPEYKRSDFGVLARGKYIERLKGGVELLRK